MFATSTDFLHFSLGIGFLVLVVFLCVLIFFAIVILRDVARIADQVESVTNRVSRTIVEPLKAMDYLVERLKPYVETLVEKRKAANKAAKKTAKKKE